MSFVLKVKRLRTGARLPLQATEGSTGLDLFACLAAAVEIGPDVTLVPTGLAFETPPGLDLQIRPRSGLSRLGVNAILGTIDADYRGEIFVALHTFGSRETYTIEDGDRIAQLVITRNGPVDVVEVEEIAGSERGAGGHGSTGR